MSKIRNNNGKWKDTSVFRQEAIRFLEKGYYTEAPYGTPEWLEYWKEQLRRCIEGYEVHGNKITGHHYCYLNFAQILKMKFDDEDEEETLATKEVSFPDFWDGDYNFFWSLEIARNGICSSMTQVSSKPAEKKEWNELNKRLKKLEPDNEEYAKIKKKRDEISQKILDRLGLFVKPHLDYLNGGYHFIVGKARRRGYSYKTSLIIANIYNTIRNKLSLIGAYEKKFIDQTMDKTLEYLNFFNEYTGFSKNRLVDKKNFIKAGYIEEVNGVNVEKGYKSVIDATRTFKDNPDAMRGVDAFFILLEEVGAFDNLKDSFNAIAPSLTAGSKITGQICLIGTSGDLLGGTKDYADMFFNPIPYGFMPFVNIWDKDAEDTTCGFFHPISWNLEGFYDEQGNSDVEAATAWENQRRKKLLDNSTNSLILQKHIQEFPLCPADAFSVANINVFPTIELRNRLNKVMSGNLHLKMGTPVELFFEDGKVVAKPDLKNKLQPIWNYRPKDNNLEGCPIIYEYPIKSAPKGLYKIGFDPYRQDMSNGVSLGAIYVFKGVHKGSLTKNCIVAQYVGRPQESDDVSRIAMMFAILYNTEVMFENEVTHVKNYFRRMNRLDLLALQPDRVISNNIKNSKVARVYGCHMNEKMKDAGEKYIKDWLLEVQEYDENGSPITTIDSIYDIGLLEELIAYNRKVNTDRVMAIMQVMFQRQEEQLDKVYDEDRKDRIAEVFEVLKGFYRKR
jgi:hypothetical protein|nr:MAG TPA: Terminase large subunit [Caudoviricetes sp.]